MLKELTGKLKYMGRSIVVNKYTFHFKNTWQGRLPRKDIFVQTIVLVIPDQFKSSPYYHTTQHLFCIF